MEGRKKLYYAPGMTSLLGFLFILPYCYDKAKPNSQTVIPLSVPKISTNEHCLFSTDRYLFSTAYILHEIKGQKKLRFLLTGDAATNRKKINLIRYEARKLKYSLDSLSVISVMFSDDLAYGDFIKLLDNCITDSICRYAIWNNNFIILREFPPRPATNEKFECLLCGDVIRLPDVPVEMSLFEKISSGVKPFSLFQISGLAILWLLLIILSSYKTLRETGTL